jgi:hypothetical protein
MFRGRVLWLGAAGALLLGAMARDAGAEPRAVIELFTSQGCSSCPAADALLSELKQDPSLVTLTLPIDYWDYLGWKDTLANPRNTARQKAYSHMRGDRDVYTPQAVINGTAQALGSDRAEIERAIADSRSDPATLSALLSVSVADGKVSVSAGKAKRDGVAGEVWLCGVAKSVTVAVARGENSGRKLTYTNVARRWLKLGTWTGAPQSWTIPADEVTSGDLDSIAVIVQSGSMEQPGPILGAAVAALH